jgi:hypothetical protein
MKPNWLLRLAVFSLLTIIHFIPLNLKAQNKVVAGNVMTGDSVLTGATVQIKGKQTTTQTDAKGNFSINVSAGATLIVTSVGYVSKEVKVDNKSFINVYLQPSVNIMNEVVVVGYGTQKKATLTGSVTSVKGSDINKSPSVNVSNSLVGRLPGLVAVNGSG